VTSPSRNRSRSQKPQNQPQPNTEAEQGYAVAGLFNTWDDGAIWTYAPPQPIDFDAMLARDGQARKLFNAVTLPLRRAPITVEPAKGDNGGAALVKAQFDAMTTPLQAVQTQMCSAILYRNAFFEKVLELVDGQVTLRKLAFRPPQTCAPRIDPKTGGYNGFEQVPRVGTENKILIDPPNAFTYTHGAVLRPIVGQSDFDVAYWAYKTKEKIRFIWYQWLECASQPRTAVTHSDETIRNAIVKQIAKLRRGGVIGLAQKAEVQTIAPVEPAAAQAYQDAMRWLDGESSGSVLASFLDLAGAAASGTGSFALSKDQSDFFIMALQAVADEMSAALTTYVARDLVKWNLGADSPVPKVVIGPVAEADTVVALSLLETAVGTQQIELPPSFLKGLVAENARTLGMDTAAVVAELDQAIADAKAEREAMQQQTHPGDGLEKGAPKPAGELAPNIAQRSVSSAIRKEEPKLPGLSS
jgi:hypothetical protein